MVFVLVGIEGLEGVQSIKEENCPIAPDFNGEYRMFAKFLK